LSGLKLYSNPIFLTNDWQKREKAVSYLKQFKKKLNQEEQTMKKRLKYVIFKTKWGFFGLLADEGGLLRTSLPSLTFKMAKRYLLVGMFRPVRENKRLYPALQKAITHYYKGTCIDFYKSLFTISYPEFSDFALKVIKVCKAIPPGKTITYAELARKAGFPKAARAVGNVLAKNPLPLLIPCHRVIRADGKIGNFSAPGGSKMKKKMLEYEKGIGCRI
jgi:O-6-methylguanine DNA methyltransferase